MNKSQRYAAHKWAEGKKVQYKDASGQWITWPSDTTINIEASKEWQIRPRRFARYSIRKALIINAGTFYIRAINDERDEARIIRELEFVEWLGPRVERCIEV